MTLIAANWHKDARIQDSSIMPGFGQEIALIFRKRPPPGIILSKIVRIPYPGFRLFFEDFYLPLFRYRTR